MMTPQKQGYVFIAITMCIWGGFTLTARLSANWGIGALGRGILLPYVFSWHFAS